MTLHDDGLPLPQRYWAMLSIGLGISMSVLDTSIANIALPSIAQAVQASPAQSIWVINAYQLAIIMTLLPLASLGEQVGYRRVYQAGVLVFTVGSLACALSASLPAVIASRALQGLGAAGLMSVNAALVRFTYPRALLGRGIGINAMTVSIFSALGPTIAAAVLSLASWQWLFAINVPVGIVNGLLASRALPEAELSEQPFGWPGALLSALALGLLFLGVDAFTHSQWSSWIGATLLIIAVAAGGYLIQQQRHLTQPLIPLDLLRIRAFSLAAAVSLTAFTAYALAFVSLPFYFVSELHRSQAETGLLLTPWPVAVALTAPVAGRLCDRVSPGLLVAVGLALLSSSFALLAVLSLQASWLQIAWRMVLSGVGFGLFQTPNNRVFLSSAPRARSGAAGGMLAAARQVGMTAGAALAAVVFWWIPSDTEPVSLGIAAALGIVAASVSLLRSSQD
jgi:MFS transporter, DHA2 family, multidrug resistance protein